MKLISVDNLKIFFNNQLSKRGLSEQNSKNITNALINASLMGIDSHGVRLFRHYIDCLDNGRVKKADVNITRNNSVVSCDANNSFAHNAAQILLEELNDKSEVHPIQMGVILNSDHYGASGIHAYNSNIKNKLIISFTNADALANSPDGKSIVFGTNPISLIFRDETDLLYIDLATTKFSMNKVKNYRLSDDELPDNTARDSKGDLTNNPHNAVSLEPIGGHKGFALAFLIEILTSGLTGMNHSSNLLKMYGSDITAHRGVSHTFILIDPSFFPGGVEGVKSVINITRSNLENEQLSLSPGIKEFNSIEARSEEGIPVDDSIVNQWKEIGYHDS